MKSPTHEGTDVDAGRMHRHEEVHSMKPSHDDEMTRALRETESRDEQSDRHVEEAAFRAEVRARLADLERLLGELASARSR